MTEMTLSADLVAGAIGGGLVAAVVGIAAVKVRESYRRTRARWRKLRRTRVMVTQEPKKRKSRKSRSGRGK